MIVSSSVRSYRDGPGSSGSVRVRRAAAGVAASARLLAPRRAAWVVVGAAARPGAEAVSTGSAAARGCAPGTGAASVVSPWYASVVAPPRWDLGTVATLWVPAAPTACAAGR